MMQVITHNQIVGFHRWLNAPIKYAYLGELHRHVFAIRCRFKVSHTGREIEINDMQEHIEREIRNKFVSLMPDTGDNVYFDGMSCEDIAIWCIEHFGCDECEVLEDGFGGAYVRK